MNFRKYLNNQNWNIGFATVTPSELILRKRLPKVQWMKHSYRDRFFADPFILSVDKDYIYVLAEELIFGEKGTIVWLKVDKQSYCLIERKQLLKLDTHLSYPLIIRHNGRIYIMPENSESGHLSVYMLSLDTLELKHMAIVCFSPVTDATTFKDSHGNYYMIATELPNSQNNAYLYKYNINGQMFERLLEKPIITGLNHSRMGGDFFQIDNQLYRPAQDCSERYGKALTILQIDSIKPAYKEHPIFKLKPISWHYNLGLHTLNFDKDTGLAVIDSYGYLYPFWGRLMMLLHRIKRLINGRTSH